MVFRMIEHSFSIDTKNILKLQNSVKSSGCRFVYFKPDSNLRKQWVIISGDSESMNKFNELYSRLTTNINETTKKRNLFFKIKNFFNLK